MRVLAFALLSCIAASTGMVTAATDAEVFAGDSRLIRSVSIEATGTPLETLLQELSTPTGVALTASASLREDKVVIFSPPRALRASLEDLAGLLGGRWKTVRSKDGTTGYLLERRAEVVDLENKLLTRRRKRIGEGLAEQVRALSDDPAVLRRRAEADPIRKSLSNPSGRVATYLFGFTNAAHRSTLLEAGVLRIPFNALRNDQRRLVRDELAKVIAQQEAFRNELRARFAAEGVTSGGDVDKVEAVVAQPGEIEEHGLRFELKNDSGAAAVDLWLGPRSRLRMAAMDGDAQWVLPANGNPYSSKSDNAKGHLPPVSTIHPALELEGKARWVEQVRKLSDATGASVFADFYRGVPLAKPRADEAAPLPREAPAALDRFCRPHGYLWWTRGSTMLFRKRDWFAQSLYETPDSWLESIIESLNSKQATPTVGDILSLRRLSLTQVIGLNALPDRRYYELDADGRGCNLNDLSTDLQLLEWSKADPKRPLLGWRGGLRITPEVLQQKQIPLPELGMAQQALLLTFLAGKTGIPPQIDARGIGLELSCNQDYAVVGHPQVPMGHVNVELSWTYPGRPAEQTHVLLPLEWPERQKPSRPRVVLTSPR